MDITKAEQDKIDTTKILSIVELLDLINEYTGSTVYNIYEDTQNTRRSIFITWGWDDVEGNFKSYTASIPLTQLTKDFMSWQLMQVKRDIENPEWRGKAYVRK